MAEETTPASPKFKVGDAVHWAKVRFLKNGGFSSSTLYGTIVGFSDDKTAEVKARNNRKVKVPIANLRTKDQKTHAHQIFDGFCAAASAKP